MYTTIILTNDTLKVDDKTYTIDNEGVVTEFTAKNQLFAMISGTGTTTTKRANS